MYFGYYRYNKCHFWVIFQNFSCAISSDSMNPVIVIHGGAAPIIQQRILGKVNGVQTAAKAGYCQLMNEKTAVDAVEAAIRSMENDEYFNAGFGSILNLQGQVEMDASIMDGKTLSAGSAAIIRDVEHPISLARLVMDKSPHVLIAGSGVSKFAKEQGMAIVSPESLVSNYAKTCLEMFIKMGACAESVMLGGTVGAVALDMYGNVAAGTSTGGTNGKLNGRIGDSPIIGCGTYADNNLGASSSTGHGEAILRVCLAHSVVRDMQTKTPQEAAEFNVRYLHEKTGSPVGSISVSKQGEIGIFFNSTMMPWASIKGNQLHFGVLPGEDLSQPVSVPAMAMGDIKKKSNSN